MAYRVFYYPVIQIHPKLPSPHPFPWGVPFTSWLTALLTVPNAHTPFHFYGSHSMVHFIIIGYGDATSLSSSSSRMNFCRKTSPMVLVLSVPAGTAKPLSTRPVGSSQHGHSFMTAGLHSRSIRQWASLFLRGPQGQHL